MNKYFYDVSTNAFYPIAMKEIYESNGMNFDNAKEVDEELFIEYSGEPPKGKSALLVKMVFLPGVIFRRQRTINLLQQLKHKTTANRPG